MNIHNPNVNISVSYLCPGISSVYMLDNQPCAYVNQPCVQTVCLISIQETTGHGSLAPSTPVIYFLFAKSAKFNSTPNLIDLQYFLLLNFRPILVGFGTGGNILICIVMRRGSLRKFTTCFYMSVLGVLDTGQTYLSYFYLFFYFRRVVNHIIITFTLFHIIRARSLYSTVDDPAKELEIGLTRKKKLSNQLLFYFLLQHAMKLFLNHTVFRQNDLHQTIEFFLPVTIVIIPDVLGTNLITKLY